MDCGTLSLVLKSHARKISTWCIAHGGSSVAFDCAYLKLRKAKNSQQQAKAHVDLLRRKAGDDDILFFGYS